MPKKTPKGFTLVEMLVATALVVLMMMMFAQIFQTAGGLVSNQKGMAQQDQNVRTLTILLRGDVSQRTFREVIPFYPGQDTQDTDDYKSALRQGFFSISENDPDDGTDDVLHLTIKVDEGEVRTGSPQLPFSGRAALIRTADPGAITPIPSDPPDGSIDSAAEGAIYLYGDPNDPSVLPNNDQPEFDDGQLTLNGTGSSRFMEVCWFLRNGVLYRRAFLIRERYADVVDDTLSQPINSNGLRFIPGTIPLRMSLRRTPGITAAASFRRDFDYSAYYEPTNPNPGGLRFHDVSSLINAYGPPPATNPNLLNMPASLGLPFLRFGSSTNRASTGITSLVIQGPRENLTAGTTNNLTNKQNYIGRFTHRETSHSNFDYPGNVGGGDPFNDSTALTLTNGEVVEFVSTTERFRRGEDIVMTNVHSFDIQVWDDTLRAFVNLGGGGTGRYGTTANTDYGNRYDTWHPGTPGVQMPPTPFPDQASLPGGLAPVLGSADEVPLEAIRIQIRFYDIGSDSMRDLTFTFPLNP